MNKLLNGKRCINCREDIHPKARKCPHCSGWQSWRYELANLGPTLLSLLIALVSVVVAAIPMVMASLVPKSSVMTAAFQSANSQIISAVVSNSGSKPGSINRAIIRVPAKGGHFDLQLQVQTPDGAGAALITAGSSVLVLFKPESLTRAVQFKAFGASDVTISLGAMPDGSDKLGKTLATSFVEAVVHHRPCSVFWKFTNFDGKSTSAEQSMPCEVLNPIIAADTGENIDEMLSPTTRF